MGHVCNIPGFAANGSDEDEEIVSSETASGSIQTEVDGAGNVDLLVIPPDNLYSAYSSLSMTRF